MPDTNNIDLDCPLGVSAFSDAVGFIRDADEQWERILWELESSERAIDASEDLFRFNPETNQPVLPKGRERMYHCLEATGEGGKTIYNTFSPEVRDNSYFHALNQIFRQIENTTGLSYGTISEVSDVEKTAEEVKISKQRSFVRVCDIQKNLQTALEQLAAAVSLRQAEDAGCYLMEITAHSGARPDHAEWQGQLVTITGKDAGKIIDGLRVFTLSEIGYGSGEGFKGWNCRHNWHAYYPGLSTPNYTPEELKKLDEPCISYNGKLYTEYEVSQMQRAQERRVRAWKRRCVTAQEGVQSATDEATRATAQVEFERSARYLKTNEAKLKDFCRQTGQDRDRFREQFLGFNRSTAQKAVHAAKKSGLTSDGKDGIINIERPMAAKTFDKAAKYAKEKLNLSIENISELPVEKVNKINNTIWEIYKDVPMIRGSISEILLEPTSKIASASMIWRENIPKLRLKLSKELFSNLSIKELENNIQSLVESGWFSPKDGLHGIFKHEATHFAEYIKTLEKYHYQKEAVIKSLDECELAK